MTRILFINYSTDLGGAELSLLALASSLDPAEYGATLITFGTGALSVRAHALNLRVIELAPGPTLTGLRRDNSVAASFQALMLFAPLLRQIRALRQTIRNTNASIVHTNNPKSHVLGALAAAGTGVRVVMHMRDILPPRSVGLAAMRMCAALTNASLIAISNAVKEALPPGLKQRTRVIYNGFAPLIPARTRAEVRSSLGVPEHHTVVLTVGRLVPWKGHQILLKAMVPLIKTNEYWLVIAGNAAYGGQEWPALLKEQAQGLGIGDKVIFTGFSDDVAGLFAAADIFVLASENEPFGRALVEAMLCNTPVIAFDAAGPSEIIEHGKTGLLVKERNAEALGAAITGLADNPVLRQNLGGAGAADAAERFALEKHVQAITTLYRELAHTL
ncbi:MAG: hypothetical protein A2350_16085 [Candidatus Raymondbacteria bacterium RifOxyB12_full_50_8]|uniref:Uncharacterized protein n=1 Tax=Candidatus Raymondbacteria bacterium RIFOXYD12_FULL_49_13 TaxID=1817890 RepID=A0A1F7FCH3_UNCRA|nr:MAG: hypothetical protein A2248_03430 [Candidatus Raymondbacteria bacterium RIFOXYA2_FULL_49_16]OGJ99630.1 MAG: hypothetical protein A2350_16085 [Candidatus Raymondbacteria bacterium RifOxyB12_full_50_8]OGK04212.1 MAG: hypothetical protein A2519_17775 [Candidatus Raymondbacteria bacterium RIFOXYD12_FULL_49_13]OGP42506.1 MAG: hypothetical protein A2324_17465 [Candidatus Raymondbacteria bacterium RIFOXYB2_FULL_49_35]